MAIRQIFVPVASASEAKQLIETAFAVAARFRAHVVVANSLEFRFPLFDDSEITSPAVYEELVRQIENQQIAAGKSISRQFGAAAKEAGVRVSEKACPNVATAFFGDALSMMNGLYDLVVARRPMNTKAREYDLVADALFGILRPTLLIPPKTAHLEKGAAVAWNGSPEGANALQRAVDILEPESSVVILQVGKPGWNAIPALEAVAYLESHGFRASVKHLDVDSGTTTEILLREAKKAGAGILIAGAYSHSRLREAILGGVTANLLTQSHLPILLAR